jgi:Protein of unknown function (DUF4197)
MGSKSRIVIVIALCVFASVGTQAQIVRDLMNGADKTVKKVTNKGGGLSESEVGDGLKEALRVGAKNATSKVSAPDGFFGNALIKVLMPPEAQKVEKTMRDLGLGEQVDNTILSMNRAAEDACTKAVEIFIDAIMKMSIQDAMAILRGGNNAATNYLKDKTTSALTGTFRPVIQESLDKVNATKYWATMFNTYNKLPTTFKKVNPDLPAYVTERALNGVFTYIADEEAKIRANPAARVSDLLKKVFGSQN